MNERSHQLQRLYRDMYPERITSATTIVRLPHASDFRGQAAGLRDALTEFPDQRSLSHGELSGVKPERLFSSQLEYYIFVDTIHVAGEVRAHTHPSLIADLDTSETSHQRRAMINRLCNWLKTQDLPYEGIFTESNWIELSDGVDAEEPKVCIYVQSLTAQMTQISFEYTLDSSADPTIFHTEMSEAATLFGLLHDFALHLDTKVIPSYEPLYEIFIGMSDRAEPKEEMLTLWTEVFTHNDLAPPMPINLPTANLNILGDLTDGSPEAMKLLAMKAIQLCLKRSIANRHTTATLILADFHNAKSELTKSVE